MLSKFWTYISHVGIKPGISQQDEKRFMLTNQFLVLSVIFSVIYASLFFFLDYAMVVGTEFVFTTAYIFLWLISKYGNIKLARFLFVTIVNFQVYILCLILGEESQMYVIYGPAIAIPVVLYGFRQKELMVLFVSYTIFLVFDLFRIDFASVLAIDIPVDMIKTVKVSTNIVAILCELAIVYALVISSFFAEQKLDETNVLLEDQFKTIFNNSSDALFLIDNDSKLIVRANSRAVELFEVKQEKDFFSMQLLDFYRGSFDQSELVEFRNVLFKKRLIESEIIYSTVKGNEFWGSYAIRLFEINEKSFMTVRITDITEKRASQELIKSSLHEKETLLAEIHHRVKNNLAVISGLLSLQSSFVNDEKAKDLLLESRNRIHSMSLIHEKLYQFENFASISLDVYIVDLIDNIKKSYSTPDKIIDFKVKSNNISLEIKYAVPCGLILNELISNSLKHAFPGQEKGEIRVEFTQKENEITMQVADNGIGCDINKLLKEGNTLGLTLIDSLSDQIDGTLKTVNNDGLAYQITFKV